MIYTVEVLIVVLTVINFFALLFWDALTFAIPLLIKR